MIRQRKRRITLMKRINTKSVTEATTKTTPAKTEKVTEKATKTTKNAAT